MKLDISHDLKNIVENSDEFLNSLNKEQQNIAMELLIRCKNCGELYFKNDPFMKNSGICNLCSSDPDLAVFRQKISSNNN